MFGRAGRPQFDDEGYVFALAHEDDVKIARWKAQYDQIPEDTKDPNLIRMKKKLKKKMPTRRKNEQYWSEDQYQKLVEAPPANLASRGDLPWRLLAYLLTISPDLARIRNFASKRLLAPKQKEKIDDRLNQQLLTLHIGDFIDLRPTPPDDVGKADRNWPIPDDLSAPVASSAVDQFGFGVFEDDAEIEKVTEAQKAKEDKTTSPDPVDPPEHESQSLGSFGAILQEALAKDEPKESSSNARKVKHPSQTEEKDEYIPTTAYPTERLTQLLAFRSCHPLYGTFLLDHLGIADFPERIQIFESVLEVAGSIVPQVRVPPPSDLPIGPLAFHRIDPELIARGLATANDLDPSSSEPELDNFGREVRKYAVPLGDKMRRLFDSDFPNIRDLRTRSVWIAGDVLLNFGGDFQKFVTSRDLTKQEGVIFRHLLRMILLCEEFSQFCPIGETESAWAEQMQSISGQLIETCRSIDPESTDTALESMSNVADITQS